MMLTKRKELPLAITVSRDLEPLNTGMPLRQSVASGSAAITSEMPIA